MPANYETMTAYGMARHGKFLYSYNTECGENDDPAANPAANATMRAAGKQLQKIRWAARKIVHAWATVPDKARSFTFHWFHKNAEGLVMQLLNNIRGRLVAIDVNDPAVFAVASIDGTDPYHPRPDYLTPGPELAVAIFNDHATTRTIEVPLTAPTGTQFSAMTIRTLVQDPDTHVWGIHEERRELKNVIQSTWTGSLAGKSVMTISLTLTGTPPETAEIHRTQFFAKEGILKPVAHDAPVTMTIDVPATSAPTRAWLRIVGERIAHDEAIATINGTRVALPGAPTPENVAWIREIPIDPALLKDETNIVFSTTEGHAGYLLCMASIVVETAAADGPGGADHGRGTE